LCEPLPGLRFGHDRQDFDGRARYVIEHANFADVKPVLRAAKTAQPLTRLRLERGQPYSLDAGRVTPYM
jgi:hypothetical protein